MLSMKIKEHRPLIMRYAKASGILLLDKYLPELNPWEDLEIIQNIDEWNLAKGKYPDLLMCRTDNLLGDKPVRIRGTNGKKEEVAEAMDQIKKQNKDAVMLILKNKYPDIPRYKNNGGFTVAFDLYQNIILELVGRGFDGSEITREKAVHERYIIPWSEALFIKSKKDLIKNSITTNYTVSEEEYQKNREERINTLKLLKEKQSEVETSIPIKYMQVDETIIENILDSIIFPLYCKSR